MKKEFKVVGIISSARVGSNSAVIVREVLKGAQEKGAVVEEVYLPKYKMEFCTGCLYCMKTGQCHYDDDFNELKKRLYSADGIIWGSPTYAGAPNAIMKNLIDRLGIYEATTSSLGGKYMVGVSTANLASAAKKVAKGLSRFGSTGTFSRSFASGFLGEGFRGGRLAQDDDKLLKKARVLGHKVALDIQCCKKYPFQSIPARIISSFITRPLFSKYILNNKEGDTKIIYKNLHQRGLII